MTCTGVFIFHHLPERCDKDLTVSLLQRKDVCSFQHLFVQVICQKISFVCQKQFFPSKRRLLFSIKNSCLIQTLTEAIWEGCELALLQSVSKSRHQQIQVHPFNSCPSSLTLCRRVLSAWPERQKERDLLFSQPCSQPNT